MSLVSLLPATLSNGSTGRLWYWIQSRFVTNKTWSRIFFWWVITLYCYRCYFWINYNLRTDSSSVKGHICDFVKTTAIQKEAERPTGHVQSLWTNLYLTLGCQRSLLGVCYCWNAVPHCLSLSLFGCFHCACVIQCDLVASLSVGGLLDRGIAHRISLVLLPLPRSLVQLIST